MTQDLVHRIDLDGGTGSLPAQRRDSANPVSPADPSSIPTCSLPHGNVRLVPSPGVWKNDPICYLFLGQHVVSGSPPGKPTEALPSGTDSLTQTCRRALRSSCPPRCAHESHTSSSLWLRIPRGAPGLSWEVHPQAVQASIGSSRERQSLADLTDPGTFNTRGRPGGLQHRRCELVSGENLWPRLGTTATA